MARLQPTWVAAFFRRHTLRCAVLVPLYLLAFGVLAASLERYWFWIQGLEAVASPPVKTINRWQAYCVVRTWSKPCQPKRQSRPAAAPAALHRALDLATAADAGES